MFRNSTLNKQYLIIPFIFLGGIIIGAQNFGSIGGLVTSVDPNKYVFTFKGQSNTMNGIVGIEGIPDQVNHYPFSDYFTIWDYLGRPVHTVEGRGTTTNRTFLNTAPALMVTGLNTMVSSVVDIRSDDFTKNLKVDYLYNLSVGTGNNIAKINQDGSFSSYRNLLTDITFRASLNTDSSLRFFVTASGKWGWGPGSGPQDTYLYRPSMNKIQIDSNGLGGDVGLGVGVNAPTSGIDTRDYKINGTPGVSANCSLGIMSVVIDHGLITSVICNP